MADDQRYGSDVIVDLLRDLGVDIIALNPGASFRGIHDSMVNRGLPGPRVLACLHEEIAIAIAHGYAKAAPGRLMAAFVHDIVGLQHATMAIYNAWCDRVPLLVLGSTGPVDAALRRPWIDWIHTASVQALQVRDYTKWDDQPASLAAVGESLLRAVQIATTEPCGPVYVCFDSVLQEQEAQSQAVGLDPARFVAPSAIAPDPACVEALAQDLLAAERPVVFGDYCGRDSQAFALTVELCDLLALPFVDHERDYNKVGLNFPTQHPLNLSGDEAALVEGADYVLGLEARDLFGLLNVVQPDGTVVPKLPPHAKITQVGLDHLMVKAWAADFQRMQPATLRIAAGTRQTLRPLLDMVTGELRADTVRVERIERRRARLTTMSERRRNDWRRGVQQARLAASAPDSVIPRAVLAAALDEATSEFDRVVANGHLGNWVHRLWQLDSGQQYLGDNGGAGLGYGLCASIGAALAHEGTGRLVVDIQSDGDALMTPGALWTAAHAELPILFVMDNNRAYDNSATHALRIADHRNRDKSSGLFGTLLDTPTVDFAGLARSFGVYAEGPVSRLDELMPALRRAVAVVTEQRKPALIDVITPRAGD